MEPTKIKLGPCQHQMWYSVTTREIDSIKGLPYTQKASIV